jgi:hypothetical protein
VGFAGVVVGDGAVFSVREVADVDVEFLEGEVVEFVAVVGFCEFEAGFVAEAALGVDGEVFAVLFGGEAVIAALEDVFGVFEEIGFRVSGFGGRFGGSFGDGRGGGGFGWGVAGVVFGGGDGAGRGWGGCWAWGWGWRGWAGGGGAALADSSTGTARGGRAS